MKLTKTERACLEGALRLNEKGEVLGPKSGAGAKACRSLEKKGLLRLVGWLGQTVASQVVYEITLLGCSELSGVVEGCPVTGCMKPRAHRDDCTPTDS